MSLRQYKIALSTITLLLGLLTFCTNALPLLLQSSYTFSGSSLGLGASGLDSGAALGLEDGTVVGLVGEEVGVFSEGAGFFVGGAFALVWGVGVVVGVVAVGVWDGARIASDGADTGLKGGSFSLQFSPWISRSMCIHLGNRTNREFTETLHMK